MNIAWVDSPRRVGRDLPQSAGIVSSDESVISIWLRLGALHPKIRPLFLKDILTC
ncbi:hypothetical protein BH10PSE18_BH10PSE18_39450 [soil metagenome]